MASRISDEEPLTVFGVGDPARGKFFRRPNAQETGLEFRVRAHRLPDIGLLIPQAPREARALGEELDLLNDPAGAVRVMRLLGHDASIGHAAAGRDGHGLAAGAARADEIADFGSGFTGIKRPLQVLAPQRLRSAAREELDVIGGILVGAKLIVGAAVLGEAAHEERAAAARLEFARGERGCLAEPAGVTRRR